MSFFRSLSESHAAFNTSAHVSAAGPTVTASVTLYRLDRHVKFHSVDGKFYIAAFDHQAGACLRVPVVNGTVTTVLVM
jgi:hypothetical protein